MRGLVGVGARAQRRGLPQREHQDSSHPRLLTRAQLEEDNRDILRLLRESSVAEKLEGLKRLIAQSTRGRRPPAALPHPAPPVSVGRDVSDFFAAVVRRRATRGRVAGGAPHALTPRPLPR